MLILSSLAHFKYNQRAVLLSAHTHCDSVLHVKCISRLQGLDKMMVTLQEKGLYL
uniref:Uncharacterized protein n=1 Tax=Anguilla anguilla TaxID=7936 RepID=A0A0E9PIB9_ANGAN